MRILVAALLLSTPLPVRQQAPPPREGASLGAAPAPAGVLNFRDVGGLRTADGRAVRHGMIFRSGELSHLMPADAAALAPLHVVEIFDLRTDAERASAPTHWPGNGASITVVPVGLPAGESQRDSMRRLFANGTDPDHVREAMQRLTVQIALDGAPEIGRILRKLAAGDEPALIHCTAGKDRTGVVTAVLLRVLGVPQEAVLADYLRSNDAVAAQAARLTAPRASVSPVPGGGTLPPGQANPLASLPEPSIRVLMGVDRSYLQAAFDGIDTRYGSFDGYIREGLRLNDAEVQQLKDRLLEAASAAVRG